ncbi:2-C-methyl-D-erythritol 2,4-cyclodiphosphate synthase, chloroplastic [Tanacetum coccineum]
MATSSPIYTTSPLHTTTKTFSTRLPTRRSSLTLRGNENRAVVVVKAVVEAENIAAVKKNIPAKVLPFRVGHGFDLHRLEPGYPLIIGGIDIPHERGCEAHSDGEIESVESHVEKTTDDVGGGGGDMMNEAQSLHLEKCRRSPRGELWCAIIVSGTRIYGTFEVHVNSMPVSSPGMKTYETLKCSYAIHVDRLKRKTMAWQVVDDKGCDVLLHCVVDAILGALGLPDIGQIFPDSDPKWKGAASSVFIKEAVRLMDEAGYELGNLDATLILQRPKLSPHKENIRANLSALLGADPAVVNLKAKTHEKVDSLGENRSIAAHTVVLLMKK